MNGITLNLLINRTYPSWFKDNQKQSLNLGQKTQKSARLNDSNVVGISEEDLCIKYGHLAAGINPLKTQSKVQNISQLKDVQNKDLLSKFTSAIGVEIDHLLDNNEKQWILNKYYELFDKPLNKEDQLLILEKLLETKGFESFLNTAFVGAKRFSIEGGESYIPMVEKITSYLAERGTFEVIICMAHRGRLATLTGIAKKPYSDVMREFEGHLAIADDFGSGDVKYHMGFESYRKFNNNTIKVIVPYNPSHLEAINPVGMGFGRARQDYYRDHGSRRSAALIMVHGDASFAGQGVVAETLQMSKLKNFNSGGNIHIVINNQVGFTANKDQAFGGRYCTDIAKAIEAPIFHVNGDDPESCFKVATLAAMYKSHFCKDIVIDLVCYRKYGHNESDEPAYTQPIMYQEIKNKSSIADGYSDYLISQNAINESYVVNLKTQLNKMFAEQKGVSQKPAKKIKYDKTDVKYYTLLQKDTAISKDKFSLISKAICSYSSELEPNPKIKKLLETREKNIANNVVDWATAELIAYGSLLYENHYVNLTGQDVERGTFSHRHAVLTDFNNGKKYNLLDKIHPKQEYFADIYNSFLSEFGILGFQYGYSVGNENGLTIWEGQFGDFANGAATIIDQFISSGETKWLQRSNLVMLLPHGMEGQGPEHSSARLERFLQGCAENNMIIANCTSPANLFHILRRQVLAKHKVPLIIMSPKSLLRHKLNVSSIDDFTGKTGFLPVIGDNFAKYADVKKVIISSGKFAFDLIEKRNEINDQSVAILRLEQYYPFPVEILQNELLKYTKVQSVIWAQEESQNMGALNFIRDYLPLIFSGQKDQTKVANILLKKYHNIGIKLIDNIVYISRKASASPACGSYVLHNEEQAELLAACFDSLQKL